MIKLCRKVVDPVLLPAFDLYGPTETLGTT